MLSRFGRQGLGGQIAIGALLGVVWTPCGGPTLGTSISLAAQRESLPAAAAVMAAYSTGAAMPLLVLAYGSRRVLDQPRRLAAVSRVAKSAIGFTLVVIGALTLMGADKALEAVLVEQMPPWLVDLTTRFRVKSGGANRRSPRWPSTGSDRRIAWAKPALDAVTATRVLDSFTGSEYMGAPTWPPKPPALGASRLRRDAPRYSHTLWEEHATPVHVAPRDRGSLRK